MRRLQLGTSKLENLPAPALRVFCDKTWTHLGDAPIPRPLIKQLLKPDRPELYAETDFRPFNYAKGDSLQFADGEFSLIFSEHFFEHLFFDEAMALFRECRRMLRADGVLRISVPDADLRTYEAPEPAGFPSLKMPFTHPDKHKTRWSVYLLGEALSLAGFAAHPLRHCDRAGVFHTTPPLAASDPLVTDTSYLIRQKSLVMDARHK